VASSRLQASIEAMQEFFPNFVVHTGEIESKPIAIWKGRVQPIQSLEGMLELLDDIHNGRPVQIFAGGEVRHHNACCAKHQSHEWFEELSDLHLSFDLSVKYEGDAAHPKTIVNNLVIPPHGANHMYGEKFICAYAPWEGVWKWQRDTVADYMGHILTWLIKWTVWCQAKIWIGPEISHSPSFLLRRIGRNQECRCGSGVKYKKCCLQEDQEKAKQMKR